MSKRCRGHCCRRFFLPFTPAALQEEARKAQEGTTKFNKQELLYVVDMVIPLDRDTGIDGKPPGEGGYYYTCKYHDPVSGDCTEYANRPRMCSEYPYGGECKYRQCACNPPRIVRWAKKLWMALSSNG